ncbi:MAG: hypothetical protein ACOY0R_00760 [Chloroflexota bacterium]
MTYQLFDLHGQEVTPVDLQNRAAWYRHGVRREDVFVETYGDSFGVRINPAKKTDPTVPDLLHQRHLADLKCQNTPFFHAYKLGIDPTYAVTFNLKDAYSYGPWGKAHADLVIFYWVDWAAVRMVSNGKSYSARPLSGVWRVEFSTLDRMRISSPIHWYNQRNRQYESQIEMKKSLTAFEPRLADGEKVWSIRETGINAACSYVFDLRKFERLA